MTDIGFSLVERNYFAIQTEYRQIPGIRGLIWINDFTCIITIEASSLLEYESTGILIDFLFKLAISVTDVWLIVALTQECMDTGV